MQMFPSDEKKESHDHYLPMIEFHLCQEVSATWHSRLQEVMA